MQHGSKGMIGALERCAGFGESRAAQSTFEDGSPLEEMRDQDLCESAGKFGGESGRDQWRVFETDTASATGHIGLLVGGSFQARGCLGLGLRGPRLVSSSFCESRRGTVQSGPRKRMAWSEREGPRRREITLQRLLQICGRGIRRGHFFTFVMYRRRVRVCPHSCV